MDRKKEREREREKKDRMNLGKSKKKIIKRETIICIKQLRANELMTDK